MKNGKLFLAACALLFVVLNHSCQKETVDPTEPNIGDWLFWTDSSIHSSQIRVHFAEGDSGDITGVYNAEPNCNTFGCYTIDLTLLGISSSHTSGTFAYTALDSVSPFEVRHWSSTIVVTSDNWQHCNSTLLH